MKKIIALFTTLSIGYSSVNEVHAQTTSSDSQRNIRFAMVYVNKKFAGGFDTYSGTSWGIGVGRTIAKETITICLNYTLKDIVNYSEDQIEYEIETSSAEFSFDFNTRWVTSRLLSGPTIGLNTAYCFQKGNNELSKNPGYSGMFIQFNVNWPREREIPNKKVSTGERFRGGIFIQPGYNFVYNINGEQGTKFMGRLELGARIGF